MYKLKFLVQCLLMDVYFRNACRNTFEYKQHKATLKKMQKKRTILDKVLGLYSSSRTHAPHHMKLYKVVRVLNLLLCLMGIVLWIGKKISIQEGARVVGHTTITKIFNPLLCKSWEDSHLF